MNYLLYWNWLVAGIELGIVRVLWGSYDHELTHGPFKYVTDETGAHKHQVPTNLKDPKGTYRTLVFCRTGISKISKILVGAVPLNGSMAKIIDINPTDREYYAMGMPILNPNCALKSGIPTYPPC